MAGNAGDLVHREGPQCCSTHGSNNGSLSYDGGAVEIANTSRSSFTVDAVTVDFGGGSSPSRLDLWTDRGPGTLPLTLAPGHEAVMTMTNGFNFDTSDLFGEACHVDTGVVPVVDVTVDGHTTAYDDDHQVLNSEGTDLASCPGTGVSEQHPFAALAAGRQPAAAPANHVSPYVTGYPVQGHVLSAMPGGWDANPPPALSPRWARCDRRGSGCTLLAGITAWTYFPTAADVGHTVRTLITATNASGSLSVFSGPSAVIAAGPPLAHFGDIYPGFTSTFVTSAGQLGSVFTARHNGTSVDFEFYARGAGSTQQFTPRVYAVVNGQQAALLASGAAVSVARGANGRWYVSGLRDVRLGEGQSYELALVSSGAFNGSYVGANRQGTNAFFLDYG